MTQQAPAFQSTTEHLFHRLQRQPYLLVPGIMALMRGVLFKVRCLLSFGRIRVQGIPRIYGTFYVTGPGRVRIGRGLYVDGRTIKPVSLSTVHAHAELLVGDHCGFNGTSVRCHQSIRIGDYSNIADAYIVDSPSHRLSIDRRNYSSEDVPAAPVEIGRNVWISVNVVVLHGVRIGHNSVIGACSLVRHDVPDNVFAAGNPLQVIRPLDQPPDTGC